MEIEGKVGPGLPRLVPKIFTRANYFIYGGVAFVELTYNAIANLGRKSGQSFRVRYLGEFPEKPYQKIVIISEIFPEYGLVKTSRYRKRVETVDGKEVLNIEHLFNTLQKLKKNGKKKVLLGLDHKLELPLDLAQADELDRVIKGKYGILYMRSPGGFLK